VAAGTSQVIPELPIIRARGEGEQRATFCELFVDLVYVFAVTQLSHHLLADISWSGATAPATGLSVDVVAAERSSRSAAPRSSSPV
jgi:hypothetical protein